MGRPVVHWEFWSEDPARLSNFYEQVFDWGVRSIESLDYRLVEPGGAGGINGGIMKPKQGPWPAKLALYIDVDDLDAYAERIKRHGGKMLIEKMDVPGVGQLSLFEDPDGRCLGMWKQIAGAAAKEQGEDFEMEVVLKTNNPGLLAVFESSLNGAEIPYFVRGAEAASLLPLIATVVVPSRQLAAAQELLREIEEAHESDESDEDDEETVDD